MEPLVTFVVSVIVPIWVQKLKRKYKWITGDEIVLILSLLAGALYVGYIALFVGIPERLDGIMATFLAVFGTFWTGATMTYGLFYKHYYKGRNDRKKTPQ